MGKHIIYNLSTLDNVAAMLRVAVYMAGDKRAAEQDLIIVLEKKSNNSNTVTYTVKDKENNY